MTVPGNVGEARVGAGEEGGRGGGVQVGGDSVDVRQQGERVVLAGDRSAA